MAMTRNQTVQSYAQLHLPANAVIQQQIMRSPWHTAWLKKLHYHCFVKDIHIITDYKTIGGNVQELCSKIIMVVAMHHALHSPVWCVHFIQVWS